MRHHHDARYPFVWIQSTEEDRIIRENRDKIDEDVVFYSWDIAAGFQVLVRNGGGAWIWQPYQVPGHPAPQKGKGIVDPGMALDAVPGLPIQYSEDEQGNASPIGAIIFMKDFHKYFEKITIARAALNLKPELKFQAKTICFLSAEKTIPPELADDITVLEAAYPDEKSLMHILEKMVEDNERDMPEEADVIINALKGLTYEGAENALALALATRQCFDVPTLLDQKAAQIKASGALEYGHFAETLDELHGLEVLKRYVHDTIGKKKARGVLMYGVPGAGKSHMAKAVANEYGLPCLILRLSKDRYQGVAENRLRNAFKIIRAIGKCVVFMDEIEAIATGISTGGDSGTGMTLYKELLREMEDSRGRGIYWMATTNDLEPLIHECGGAIMRRFGGKFFIDMPTEQQARGIARIWSEKEGVEIPETFPLDGYTGADIASLAENMAMMECSVEDAAMYVLPYGHAHPTELETIREKAEGICIPASKPEQPETKEPTRKVRRVR